MGIQGLDNITIGHSKEKNSVAKTHQTLLSAGIYILEDCALANVPPGEYELLCLPLHVQWRRRPVPGDPSTTEIDNDAPPMKALMGLE
jgi:hypothetical protein